MKPRYGAVKIVRYSRYSRYHGRYRHFWSKNIGNDIFEVVLRKLRWYFVSAPQELFIGTLIAF